MSGKLVIGYEATRQGEDALALAAALADLLDATPIVTTVLPWPSNLIGREDRERAVQAATEVMLTVACDRLSHLAPTTRVVVNRAIAEALHQLAEEERATAIVIGSSHRGATGRVLAGSVGESLLHGACCPVAMAPRGFAQLEEYSPARVAACFDGSSESWAALEAATGLAKRAGGSLTVLTVADSERYGYAAGGSVLAGAGFQKYEREDKRRLLDLAVRRAARSVRVDGRLLDGDPGALLAEATGEFDLIVSGSRGYGSLRRTVLGSTTASLMRRSKCPVLVLPRGGGEIGANPTAPPGILASCGNPFEREAMRF